MRMEAHGLRQVDEMHKMHIQAWATQNATATKNIGTEKKPKIVSAYDSFNDFFDYEKAIDTYWYGEQGRQKQITQGDSKLIYLLERANKKGGK